MFSDKTYAGLFRIFTGVALCVLLASCSSLKAPPYDDYIGPLRRPPVTPEKPFQADVTPPKPAPEGPIEVTVEEAILLAPEPPKKQSKRKRKKKAKPHKKTASKK